MEREAFASGYCRRLDGSRMVEVIVADGKVTETDCDYGACLYQSACPVAKKIDEMIENSAVPQS